MVELTVGVIGVGHFGTALIKGMLSHSNQVQILLTERDTPKLMADEYHHRISGSSVKGTCEIKSRTLNSSNGSRLDSWSFL